jgi:amino acid adenylation domain-containing protein
MTGENENTGFEIAVIGMAGRFPGAKNIDEFWDNLKNGVESITFFSQKELEGEAIDSTLLNNPYYVKARGVLEKFEYFDSSSFGYTPREAEIIDPQVRIFHEITWEVLEDAGYDPDRFKGLIGVYAGAGQNHYWEGLCALSGKTGDLGKLAFSQLVDKDFFTMRISYALNLMGPSYSIYTACSTSLVAIHLACQALLNGECDVALAGGVTILLPNTTGYIYEAGMILSPDGHCRTFDARAKGTMGGSGAGIVALKLLEDALEDRDHIYAVIKGSAINNDGMRKGSFTAPAVEGQAEVIRAAQQAGHVEPGSISCIEAHGSGTSLGDPIEIEAVKLAFDTTKTGYCAIGSVKSNVGHLDTAAGVAGFIKVVLALKYKLIPPSLHFEAPNPEIDFDNSPFYVNTTLKEWKRDGGPLRAGVSSFGIGGTNAHVILEEAPGQDRDRVSPPFQSRDYQLILLSAKTESALDRMTQNLANHLEKNPGIHPADAAYTLQVCRRVFKYRRMLVCQEAKEAIHLLSSPGSAKVKTLSSTGDNPTVVFMFSGLGGQYVNMGRELYEKEKVFRQEIDRCFEILNNLLDYDIKEILYPIKEAAKNAEGREGSHHASFIIHRFEITQLVVFIFEYALAKLLMKWGIKPDAMIGYSFGEYTAACIAGVFSLEDALKLVKARGDLLKKIPPGAMLSVPLPKEELTPLLPPDLSLAIDNGPSCIAAGTPEAVAAFEKEMKNQRCLTMPLPASRAIHSHMMEPILKEFARIVSQFTLNDPQIPYISNVTGEWITPGEAVDPGYWVNHLRETVRFSEGIKKLVEDPLAIFLEIGPGSDLTALLGRYLEDEIENKRVINLVKPQGKAVSDLYYLLNRLGRLWLLGVQTDWDRLYGENQPYRIPLPTYPFEGHRYWIDRSNFKMGSGVRERKSQEGRKSDIADWFYVPSWKRIAINSEDIGDMPVDSCWLVFMDTRGLGSQLVKQLVKNTRQVITVRMGETFLKENDTQFSINPDHAYDNDYDILFDELCRMETIPDRIVHLWSVTSGDQQTTGIERVTSAKNLGYYSLEGIAQAIGKQGIKSDIQLTVVTNHLHEVTGEDGLYPEKAIILGQTMVIPTEFANIKCRGIDVVLPLPGSSPEEKLVQQLHDELISDTIEPVVAYRGGYRWVQFFEPRPLQSAGEERTRLKPKGVYLITGGLGGVGLVVAEGLAKNLGAKLILTGRTGLPPRDQWEQALENSPHHDSVSVKIRKVKEMEESGAEVLVFSADVANPEKMQGVIDQAEQQLGPITGIIHCAGLTDGQMIQRRTQKTSERIFRSKITGTLVLDALFKDKALDFFVLCSSLNAILPGFGQAAYCGANAFLDSFANRKNAIDGNNTLVVSINWDRWQSIGSAVIAERHHREMTGKEATKGMSPGEGLETFNRILANSLPQVAVSTRDLRVLVKNAYRYQGSFFKDRLEQTSAVKTAVQRPQLDAEYVAPENDTQQALAHIWATFFGFEKVGIQDDFLELGGDSLKAITIISMIYKQLNTEIPLAEFFNRATIRELAEYIESAEKSHFTAIDPVEKKDYYMLTPPQMRMYILQQMDSENIGYNQPASLVLEGEFDGKRLEDTFNKLIMRHESLRTSFEMINNQVVQRVHDEVTFEIEYYDSSLPVEEVIRRFIRPFDLSSAPLLRAGIFQLKKDSHLLVIDMHHVMSDGVSYTILINDFITLYNSRELTPLRIHYKDYSKWKNSKIRENTIKKQEIFWLKELAGEIPVLNLPTDYKRPTIQSFAGNTVNFRLEDQETAALNQLALKEKTTLYMVLLAIYNILLSKICGQEEIFIGTPIAGRDHADLEKVIGMFVNTLVMRNYPGRKKSFLEFLKEVKGITLKAFENQDYPFEELVEQVPVNRDVSRNPLFDVMFALQNWDQKASQTPTVGLTGLKVKPFGYVPDISKFDLTLTASVARKNISFAVGYCTKLFKKETIQRMTGFFKKIVSFVTREPEKKLGEIDILSDEDKQRILYDFNDTEVGYPLEKTLHELFAGQVPRTPDYIAVLGAHELHEEGTGGLAPLPIPGSITYRELNEKSNQLAHILQSKGVGPDTIVGIMTERSLEMIIGIMGILKAGGAYLPIDPDYPEERKQYMLKDSGAKILLTRREIAGVSSPEAFNNSPKGSPSLAYVIYTSGSTGRPKGVLVEHRSAVNVVTWFGRKYNLGTGIHVLQMSDYTFDPSVNQIFGTLIHGAVLYLVEKELLMNYKALRQYIETHFIHVVNFVPPVLNEILGVGPKLKSIRVVLSGGERLNDAVKTNILEQGYELYNQYGPTETTIDALVEKCSSRKVTLGTPISNVRCCILDKNRNLVPVGVAGELYIGGAGVARGYLNRPELTPEKFDHDLWDYRDYRDKRKKVPGKRISKKIYKTGDLAQWHPDGNIEFMGRIDQQVKIRGFRVELGEIESQLIKRDGIKEAVVTARESGTNDKYLCAYLVFHSSKPFDSIDSTQLRQYLSGILPEYMIPSYFVPLEHIPLTPNGKIDRKALPEPELTTSEAYVAPRNKTEEKLAELWAEVLGIEKDGIGIDTNFFELGGHSLRATFLAARIRKEFNVELPLSRIFYGPTIRELTGFISSAQKSIYEDIQPVEKREFYPQSSAQKRLFFLDQFEDISTSYNMPYIFKIHGKIVFEQYGRAFGALIERHEALRTSFAIVYNEPVQIVHDRVDFAIEIIQNPDKDNIITHRQIQDMSQAFIRPFDLSNAPLLRVGFMKLSNEEHLLLFDTHHIIGDGTSKTILTGDFIQLYLEGNLTPLKIQYKDFSLWQNHLFESGKIKEQEEYWLNLYSDTDSVPILNLPTDYPRQEVFDFDGAVYHFRLNAENTTAFKELAKESGATLYMNLLAAFNVLLHKYSGQEDVVVGTGVAGRPHPELENIIGMFVNTLAMRNYPRGEKTYLEFLKEVKDNCVKAFENQDMQFEELVNRISPDRAPAKNPFFSVELNVQNYERPIPGKRTVENAGDSRIIHYGFENTTSKFDLILFATEIGDEIGFTLEYSTALFKSSTIEKIAGRYMQIIKQVKENKTVKIKGIKVSHDLLVARPAEISAELQL